MSRPRHPRVGWFLRAGLIRNVQSFTEFERRVAELKIDKERGDAFEVLAEAYLATQTHIQAEEVWPFETVPLDLRGHLAISTHRDMGVDGVYRDNLGRYAAYQAKFRVGRAALSWRELSTFFGLSDRAGRKVLITNSEGLPPILRERVGFFCIRGSDLDRLEGRDFQVIKSWLEGAVTVRQRRDPKPHQEEAVAAVLEELQRADRATCVMACGSGKTLVSLWVAERLGAQKILVLVPSLALLSQSLHEWLAETRCEKIAYLCVCSDPTVDTREDALVLRQADLDFPVTTEGSVVSEFLRAPFAGTRWVFSTYQSAPVVAAGMVPGETFEFGVFDEAHKTAGRERTRFAFALKDSNLRISKRLFMTATPRHYDVDKRDKEGEAKLVYSMDVPEDYGRVAHTLSFREAVSKGVICDYKVLISVVTSPMASEGLLRRGETVVEGDVVGTHHVATQVALSKGIAEYPISKIFTFHTTVKAAQAFTGPGGAGIGPHLPGFEKFHVNGNMSSGERTRLIRAFEAASKGVMSNARCLTEGVDVPAVDMVAFLSPRRSKVDIVQAVGRAMRTSPGKTTGYVLVPLFLDLTAGESVKRAVKRAGFEEVWNVVQAMIEQDDELAQVISALRAEYGYRRRVDGQGLREKVEVLGPQVSLEELRRAISLALVGNLGRGWDLHFGELRAYRRHYGDCNVPQRWPKNQRLANWVQNQRVRRRRGILSSDRIAKLDSLGYEWEPFGSAWDDFFQQLVAFKAKHGHCNVSSDDPETRDLARWLTKQRSNRIAGKLRSERARRLEEIGVVWDLRTDTWENRFTELLAFRERFGNCLVPPEWAENPELATWVKIQRAMRNRREKGLAPEKIRRLDEIGFEWSVRLAWHYENLTALAGYKREYGDCNVPQRWPQNPKLAKWVQNLRIRKNTVPKVIIDQLDEMGFNWTPTKTRFAVMFERLVAYQRDHGDCLVPAKWLGDRELGTWVANLRTRGKAKFDPSQLRQLEEIGFVWDAREALWQEMLQRLTEYKDQHGNCDVPAVYSQDPALGKWVHFQRTCLRQGKMRLDRKRLLDELGFSWKPKRGGRPRKK